jgi:hypothetical protein
MGEANSVVHHRQTCGAVHGTLMRGTTHCGIMTGAMAGRSRGRGKLGAASWVRWLAARPHKERLGRPAGVCGDEKETGRAGPPGGFRPKRLE